MNTIGVILIIALVVELITLCGRFVFGISSKKLNRNLMKKLHSRHFLHFHHSFLGIILILLNIFTLTPFITEMGFGLILSDIIHHTLVLWPIVGSPEFHVVYKNRVFYEKSEAEDRKKTSNFFKHLFHKV